MGITIGFYIGILDHFSKHSATFTFISQRCGEVCLAIVYIFTAFSSTLMVSSYVTLRYGTAAELMLASALTKKP